MAVMADDALAEADTSVREAMASLVRFLRESGVAVDEQARPVDSVEAWTTYVPMVRAALVGHATAEEYNLAVAEAAKWPAGSLEFPALHWRGRSLRHRDWLRLDEVRSKL
jgi:amidase